MYVISSFYLGSTVSVGRRAPKEILLHTCQACMYMVSINNFCDGKIAFAPFDSELIVRTDLHRTFSQKRYYWRLVWQPEVNFAPDRPYTFTTIKILLNGQPGRVVCMIERLFEMGIIPF